MRESPADSARDGARLARRLAPDASTLAGGNADIYFERTRLVLEAEGQNPTVAMEVFARQRGLLGGMREAHALLSQVLPAGAEVWGLSEGSRFETLEVCLRIRAPYLAFGLYETALLGTLASESGWATAAAECVEAADGVPVISFGARHVHPEVSARMEYAACLGGCAGCATPDGAALAGLEATGTIPHALVLIVGDTVRATEAFDRHIDPRVNRIALVDTFRPEAEESVRVADALGDRLWGVRLDTPSELGGVTPELVLQVRQRLDDAGHSRVRIAVSGGMTATRIREFRTAASPVDAFGVGSAQRLADLDREIQYPRRG